MSQNVERPVAIDPADLATVKMLAAENGVFKEQSIRWMIFNADTNGIAPAIVRRNNRVFIHRPTFQKWLAGGAG